MYQYVCMYQSYLFPVEMHVLEHLHEEFVSEEETSAGVMEDVQGHFQYLMARDNLSHPNTVDSALSLYRNLIANTNY